MYIHCSLWKYSLFKEAAMKNKGENIRYFRINHFFYSLVMHLYSLW